MNAKNLSFKSEQHISVVSEWSKIVGMPSTKAVILAIDLAKKYQQLELENRALKMLLASTQSVEYDSINIAKNSIKNKTFNL
jgi:hypothetical protein